MLVLDFRPPFIARVTSPPQGNAKQVGTTSPVTLRGRMHITFSMPQRHANTPVQVSSIFHRWLVWKTLNRCGARAQRACVTGGCAALICRSWVVASRPFCSAQLGSHCTHTSFACCWHQHSAHIRKQHEGTHSCWRLWHTP